MKNDNNTLQYRPYNYVGISRIGKSIGPYNTLESGITDEIINERTPDFIVRNSSNYTEIDVNRDENLMIITGRRIALYESSSVSKIQSPQFEFFRVTALPEEVSVSVNEIGDGIGTFNTPSSRGNTETDVSELSDSEIEDLLIYGNQDDFQGGEQGNFQGGVPGNFYGG